MRKSLYFALVIVIMLFASTSWAQFVNGGFEDGTFNGWTQNGGKWYGGIGTYNYTGDQGKDAITSHGNDPIVAARGGFLDMVYSDNHAARVNNSDNNYHFSTITQSVVWNDPSIFFAWAAVLEEPGHPHQDEPHFWLRLRDTTTNTNLYEVLYASDTIPGNLLHYVSGWKWTDWQIVQLDTSAVMGHTLELTLLGSDCGQGGHGGYVYLDGFGATIPTQGAPEPATLVVMGLGLIGLIGFRKKFKK